ncbi:MAG: hypothetical protein ACD_59C00074G0004 [uncultured bacterium]|nr:MAG: hypothetical protein ACD_59C00074G0004 [uncultured bacterium]
MFSYNAIDLFSGCGGLSEGMKKAGAQVIACVEIDKVAAECYKINHPETLVINEDIRKIKHNKLKRLLAGKPVHILAGCPPCQGFSTVRMLNKTVAIDDERNDLILEYYRFIKEIKPLTFMMENVPALKNYDLFLTTVKKLEKMGYFIDYDVVDIQNYGVPQRRKRLIMLGSILGEIKIVRDSGLRKTVRDYIGNLESVDNTNDDIHKIVAIHSPRINKLISLIPKDGGGRRDLPQKYILDCHKKTGIGFHDVYGRLKWDSVSSTITGGCLNPSKGRYLHPEENRCISAREAALLQTFPRDYKFPEGITKTEIALLIGNALPPEFSRIQTANIIEHLKKFNI